MGCQASPTVYFPFHLPQRFPHFCPVFKLVLIYCTFPAFSLFLSFLKKRRGGKRIVCEFSCPTSFVLLICYRYYNFSRVGFLFLVLVLLHKNKEPARLSCCVLQEVLKWSLESVSTLGRSATYNIPKIIVYVKS